MEIKTSKNLTPRQVFPQQELLFGDLPKALDIMKMELEKCAVEVCGLKSGGGGPPLGTL